MTAPLSTADILEAAAARVPQAVTVAVLTAIIEAADSDALPGAVRQAVNIALEQVTDRVGEHAELALRVLGGELRGQYH